MKLRQTRVALAELIIVIVVIAILAAITLVTYQGIERRAHNAITVNSTKA